MILLMYLPTIHANNHIESMLMPITIGANSSDEQNHGQGLAESREGSAWIIFVSLLVYFQ